MSTASEVEAAALTAASALTIGDIEAAGRFFIKLFGGHAAARDFIAADEAAVQEALDVAEEVKIAQEPLP